MVNGVQFVTMIGVKVMLKLLVDNWDTVPLDQYHTIKKTLLSSQELVPYAWIMCSAMDLKLACLNAIDLTVRIRWLLNC